MRQSNLMLHCGSEPKSVKVIEAVPTPERTESWVPIPHGKLLSTVRETLTSQGLQVVTEAHALAKDGLRYFGLLQVNNGTEDGDFGLVVGVRNSHDKSFPAGLVLGASVFVCDNLSFSGEVKLARKHTAKIEADLPLLVDRAVGLLGNLRMSQAERFDRYQHFDISDLQAHDLVVRALDDGVIGCTHVPRVVQEWRHPSHPEFIQSGKTAWRFFNAVTEVLKGGLNQLPRRTQALHGLLDTAVGLTVPAIPFRSEDAEIQVANAV
ncbi:MAG: DUF932 domain-containing protein [Patescibacteria group bacterium]|nr:DUF932 domain-containing protein [Patescibacteria group bacterium]